MTEGKRMPFSFTTKFTKMIKKKFQENCVKKASKIENTYLNEYNWIIDT